MRYIRDNYGYIIYCIRDDGTITDKYDCDIIGHLKSDRITDKFDINILYRIRPDGTITDEYDCNIIGHIRNDGVITDKYDVDKYGKVDSLDTSSDGSSGTGCLGAIGALIILLLKPIITVCIYLMPFHISCTWLVLIAILLMFNDIIPGCIFILFICSQLMYISIPYWIIVFSYKRHEKIGLGKVFGLGMRWFFMGPLAYPKVYKLAVEYNLCPKTTRFLSKFMSSSKKDNNQ